MSDIEVGRLDDDEASDLRAALPPESVVAEAAAGAHALGDPTRLRVALALSHRRALCVADVATVSNCDVRLASHHVRLLRAAGLARSRREGRMVKYSLTTSGRALVDAVLGVVAAARSAD